MAHAACRSSASLFSHFDEIFYTFFGKITACCISYSSQDKRTATMESSANKVPDQGSTMAKTGNKNKESKDIFADRRKELIDRREVYGGIGYFNCRRQLKDRRRNKYVYDVREWWLRVNYVETETRS